jgi:hypothetical protein
MPWQNQDGLFVKFAREAGLSAQGGEFSELTSTHLYEWNVEATDINAATISILDGPAVGPLGAALPKGLRIEEIETVVQTAFTVSAGTVAAGTIVLGTVRASDRSTVLSATGLLTAAATGTVLGLGAVGTKTVIRVGSTGAGALFGTSLAENCLIAAANSTHPTNLYNGGRLLVRVRGTY